MTSSHLTPLGGGSKSRGGNKVHGGNGAPLDEAFNTMANMNGGKKNNNNKDKKTNEKYEFKGGNYPVHIGPKGGRYIMHNGSKVYIK
jgi:hypothetical protein